MVESLHLAGQPGAGPAQSFTGDGWPADWSVMRPGMGRKAIRWRSYCATCQTRLDFRLLIRPNPDKRPSLWGLTGTRVDSIVRRRPVRAFPYGMAGSSSTVRQMPEDVPLDHPTELPAIFELIPLPRVRQGAGSRQSFLPAEVIGNPPESRRCLGLRAICGRVVGHAATQSAGTIVGPLPQWPTADYPDGRP